MPRQLAFDLPVRPALERDDFFVSQANALAVAALDDWANWPSGKMALVGPSGSGKTHLAHVWAGSVSAPIRAASALTGAEVPALAAQRYVVIEDLHDLADPAAETALFHLHNLVLAEGGRLLLTAATPPMAWPLALPDLASRMQGTLVARLSAPDDALLTAMLLKLFADRQLAVPPRLIDYLLRRMDRSHVAAVQIVAALDARALAQGGKVTLAMAAELLDNSGPAPER